MTDSGLSGKKNHTVLIAVIGVLTLALLLGIKFLVNGDGEQPQEQAPAGGEALFRDNGPAQPPGYNPAARSEVTGGGGGLDMFSKTNAGYYGEETSTPTAAPQAPSAVTAKTSAPATAVEAAAKTAPRATVIPRMQAPKTFGTTAPTSITPTSAGQSMPDISALMKQAEGQARRQAKQQSNTGN